ncbi:MAG: hypothetical protein ACR2NF_08725 [Pirellulales bacterium]
MTRRLIKHDFETGVEQLENRRCLDASLDSPTELYGIHHAEQPVLDADATNIISDQLNKDSLQPVVTTDADFSIEIDFDGSIPTELRTVISIAADRWTSVIVGDLPDVQIEDGRTIDDVLIQFEVTDLQIGLAGLAGFTDIRVGATSEPANSDPIGGGLPYRGKVILNSRYIDSGDIEHVIAHEIGHVLGFGTLWQNDVGSFRGLVEGIGTDNPVFIGDNAVREFNHLFQNSDQSVPLSSRSRTVPQTYDGRYGTHWQDTVFNTRDGASELMTSSFPLAQTAGTTSNVFLSKVTVGALEDLGYSVNYAAAESFPMVNDGSGQSQSTYPAVDFLPEQPVFGPAIPTRLIGEDSGSGFLFSSDPNRGIARRLPPRITYANKPAVILRNDQETKTKVLQSVSLLESGGGTLSLSHLSDKHLAWLAAWASLEDSL